MVEQTTNINKGAEENIQNSAVELFCGTSLVFGIVKTHSASLSAQITDNYIENNTSLQDHIAFAPITVTLSGLVGDVILKSDEATQQAKDELEQAKNRQRITGNFYRLPNYIDNSSLVTTKLGSIGQLIPPLSNVTQMAVNTVSYIYNSAQSTFAKKWFNKNMAISSNVTPQTGGLKTEIEKAYEQLKNTFYAKMPNKVYTPWTTYDNMYIQSIEITQDEQNYIVDLTITLKQLRFSTVEYTGVNEEVRASYNAVAVSDLENNGKAQELESHLHKVGGDFNKAVTDFIGGN